MVKYKVEDQIANIKWLNWTIRDNLKIDESQLDVIRSQKGMEYHHNITINQLSTT